MWRGKQVCPCCPLVCLIAIYSALMSGFPPPCPPACRHVLLSVILNVCVNCLCLPRCLSSVCIVCITGVSCMCWSSFSLTSSLTVFLSFVSVCMPQLSVFDYLHFAGCFCYLPPAACWSACLLHCLFAFALLQKKSYIIVLFTMQPLYCKFAVWPLSRCKFE